MKPKSNLLRFLAIAGSSLITISSASAQTTLYWDGATPAGAPGGGAGTWDTTLTNWDTLLTGGDIAWDNTNTLGNPADIAVFGGTAGTVTLGTPITVGGLRFDTTGYTLTAGTNGLTFGATNNTIFANGTGAAASSTVSGTVGGSGNVILSAQNGGVAGANTVTFSGTSTGGWSGTTTINPGMTLSLSGSNQALLNTSAINLNGGGITLTSADNDTEDDLNRVNNSATITSHGGTITYTTTTATSARNFIETLGSVTLSNGQLNLVNTLDKSAGSQTLALSGLSRTGATNTSVVTFSNTGGLNLTNDRIRVNGITADTNTNEIIGAWATVGTSATSHSDYAIYDSDGTDGYVLARNISASAQSDWSTTMSATSNYTLGNATGSAANGKLTATRNINTLRNTSTSTSVTASNASDVINLTGHGFSEGDVVVLGGTTAPSGLTNGTVYYVINPTANNFQLSTTSGGGAALFTSDGSAVNITGGITLSSGNNLATTGILNGSGSTLAIGGSGTGSVTLPTTDAGNLYVTSGVGAIAINAPIINNTGALTLVKSGNNSLTLSGANTYSGGTVINAGALTFTTTTAAQSGSSRNITFGGSGTLTTPDASSFGTLTVNQGAVANFSGNNITFATTTGSGQINTGSNQSKTLALGNASTFTGNISLGYAFNNASLTTPSITFTRLNDAAGSSIQIFRNQGGTDSNQVGQIALVGDVAPLTFDNRQIQLLPRGGTNPGLANHVLYNNNTTAANNWVINTPLLNLSDRETTITFSGSNGGNNTFAGTLGDSTTAASLSLKVLKGGSGKWILSGSNTFTGGLVVGQGTLSVATLNEATVAGPLGMNNTLQLGGDERRVRGGTGNLVLGSNSGTLEYTGGPVTSTRTFFIGDSNTTASTGGGTIANNGTGAIIFSAATFNPTQAGITATRTLTLSGDYTATANEIQGIIQNNNTAGSGLLALTKSGSGTWKLSGTNSYTGATTITAGVLEATVLADGGSNSSIGASANTATNLSLDNGATFRYVGSSDVVTDRGFRVNGTAAAHGATIESSGTGTLSFNNTVAINWGTNNLTRTLTLGGSNSGNNVMGKVIENNGTGLTSVNKTGTGTWILDQANTYTGATTIAQGTLKLGANNVLPNSSAITVGGSTANGTLDLNGFSDTTTAVLGLGNNTTTVAGLTHSIVNTGSSSAILTVANTVIYRPGASTFENGQSSISANLGLSGMNITFDVADSPNATLEMLVSGTISGTATTLSKGNSGILRLTGPNTYAGQTFINGGTLEVDTLANAGSASSLGFGNAIAGSDVIRIGNTTTTTTLSYIGSGSSTDRRIQIGAGSASGDIGGANLLNNGSGALVFTNSTFNVANTAAIAAATRVLTLGGSNNGANTIQGAIINNGTGGVSAVTVTKQDGGTWILTNATNSYTGGTNIGGGTLAFANGSLGTTGSITFTGNSTLRWHGTNTQDISGRLVMRNSVTSTIDTNGNNVSFANGIGSSTSGSLTKTGTGKLTLNGTNNYSGETVVNGGVLELATGGTTGSGAVSVNGTGSTIIVNGTVGGSLTAGAGTVVSGSGTITGNTIISGNHSPGNSPGISTNTGDLTYNTGASVTWELIGNTDAGRGSNYDGINVGGNLNFAAATTINLVFNLGGSAVDWTNTFWDTDQTWELYDLTTMGGTVSNLSNLSIASGTWVDGSGAAFGTARPSSSFGISQTGNSVFITYTAIPEPKAALLGSIGMLLLLRRRR